MCYNKEKKKDKNMQKNIKTNKNVYSEAVTQEHVGGICGKKRKVKQMDV